MTDFFGGGLTIYLRYNFFQIFIDFNEKQPDFYSNIIVFWDIMIYAMVTLTQCLFFKLINTYIFNDEIQ